MIAYRLRENTHPSKVALRFPTYSDKLHLMKYLCLRLET